MVIPPDFDPKSIEASPPPRTEEEKEADSLARKKRKADNKAYHRFRKKMETPPSTPRRNRGSTPSTPSTPFTPAQAHENLANAWLASDNERQARKERHAQRFISAKQAALQKQLESIDEEADERKDIAADRAAQKQAAIEKHQHSMEKVYQEISQDEKAAEEKADSYFAARKQEIQSFTPVHYRTSADAPAEYQTPAFKTNLFANTAGVESTDNSEASASLKRAAVDPIQPESKRSAVDSATQPRSAVIRIRWNDYEAPLIVTDLAEANHIPELMAVTSTHLLYTNTSDGALYAYTLPVRPDESDDDEDIDESVASNPPEEAAGRSGIFGGMGLGSSSDAEAPADDNEPVKERDNTPKAVVLPAGAGNVVSLLAFRENAVACTDKGLGFQLQLDPHGDVVAVLFEVQGISNVSSIIPGGDFCVVHGENQSIKLVDLESKEILGTLQLPRHHALLELECGMGHILARAEANKNKEVKVLFLETDEDNSRLASNRFFTSGGKNAKGRGSRDTTALGVTAGPYHSMVPLLGGGIALFGDFRGMSYSEPQVFWEAVKFGQVRAADSFAIAQGSVTDNGDTSPLFLIGDPTEEPKVIDLSSLFGDHYKVANVTVGPKDCFIRVDLD